MDTTDTIDGGERAAVITVAWTPPGAEQPMVGLIQPCFQVAGGSRLILSISDVSDPNGGIAPQVVVLDIRNGPAGFVVRDATDDEERDFDLTAECEVPERPANETERLEDDARRLAPIGGMPPWWARPEVGWAVVLAGGAAGLLIVTAACSGPIQAALAGAGVLILGLAGGAVAHALSREVNQ